MTPLKDKIQDALDESRMLVLGVELFIGFAFTAHFQDGFAALPPMSARATTAALASMLVVLALLLSPCTFHQLAAGGNDRPVVHRFTTRVMDTALFPFALGLGFAIYIPAERTAGPAIGVVFALAVVVLSGMFWYGPTLWRGSERGNRLHSKDAAAPQTSMHDKIRQALTEARVIIPGNQALLAFQFALVFQKAFGALAQWLKWIHLGSLTLVTISTVLLMTPPAFHRLAERGEETPRFYRVTHWMVVAALPPLAFGVCGDFFIVFFKMSNSLVPALILTGVLLALFLILWFAYPAWYRNRATNVLSSPAEEI